MHTARPILSKPMSRRIPRAGSKRQRRARPNGQAFINHGLMQQRAGDMTAAARSFQQAIRSQPANARAYLLLARVQQQQGQIAASIQTYQRCLEHDRNNIEALINLGMLHKAGGDAATAIALYEQVVALAPDIPELHNNLGNALRDLGRHDEAEAAYRRAVELKPEFAGAWHNLGRLQLEYSNPSAALSSLRRACRLPGVTLQMRHDLADCLALLPMTDIDAELESDLGDCLALERIDGRLLGQATARYLCIQVLADCLHADTPAIELTDSRLCHPLLIKLLQREPLCDRTLESLLSRVRGQYLATRGHREITPGWLAALAYQCYLNEYVWHMSEAETATVDALEQVLRAGAQAMDADNEPLFTLYACYRPLSQLGIRAAEARSMSAKATPGFARLLRQQILDPALEAELRQGMPCLTSVSDQVSSQVRTQYEVNPYPRWQMIDQPEPRSLQQHLVELFPRLRDDSLALPASPRILVAGCGTGLQAIRMARRIPAADITAIDLSLASLAYGKRRALELDHAEQIRFAQADILQLTPAIGQFDCIECFGVLHHMADPEAGWRSLRSLLAPGGVMRIGLYSEYARAPIHVARALIRDHSLAPDLEGIRACRELIAGLPAGHPAAVLVHSPDFYSISECRDLLFHVQEQQLNLGRIAAMLERLALEFLGFEFNSLAGLNRYRSRFPDDPHAISLANWDQLEQAFPDTFSAQYVFWVRTLT